MKTNVASPTPDLLSVGDPPQTPQIGTPAGSDGALASGGLPSAEIEWPGALKKGQRMGDYVLSQFLGAGGYGAVFRAQHVSTGEPVAVKVFLEENFGLKQRAAAALQFERGAANQRRLQHPHIVRCFSNAIRDASGKLFYVMEYVSPHSLEDAFTKARLSTDDRCEIVLQIAQALEYAHSNGIAHRDIKLSNVLLEQRADGRCSAKLTDFDLCAAESDGEGKSSMAVTATLDYLPPWVSTKDFPLPEKPKGDKFIELVWIDTFALGLVAAKLLTGGGRDANVKENLADPVPLLKEKLPRDFSLLRRGVVIAVLAKALNPSRGRGYSSAADVTRDLRGLLFWKRFRPAILTSSTAVVLAIALVIAMRLYRPEVTASGSGTVLHGLLTPLRALIEAEARVRLSVPKERETGAKQDVGSENAIFLALRGGTDLAVMSRLTSEPVQTEGQYGGKVVVGVIAAVDRAAFFVHASNPIQSLPLDPLRRLLFKPLDGEPAPAPLWREFGLSPDTPRGQANRPVIAIHPRALDSGTVRFMEERLASKGTVIFEHPWNGKSIRDINLIPGYVADEPDAVGLSSIAFALKGARAVPVVDASGKEVPLVRPLMIYLVLHAPPVIPNPSCRVLRTLLSDVVQARLPEHGLGPISQELQSEQIEKLGLGSGACQVSLNAAESTALANNRGVLIHPTRVPAELIHPRAP